MSLGIAGLKAAVQTQLEAVTGIGIVEIKPGGVATWVLRPRPEQAYWTIEITAREERGNGAGPQCWQISTVRMDGFMPHSYQAPDSTATWDALVDAVCTRLREHQSLVQTVLNTDLPQLRANERVLMEPGGNSPAVLCHHAVIELRVREHLTYTTT